MNSKIFLCTAGIITYQFYHFDSVIYDTISFLVGCNNNDGMALSGTGLAQGTCQANEICYADGTCGGTCYYQNEQKIFYFI